MDRKQAAQRYFKINHWLANRYAMTDKHGRRWLPRLRNDGKPSRYAILERAFLLRYAKAYMTDKEITAIGCDDPLRLTDTF